MTTMATHHSPPSDTTPGTGFRSFWRKGNKDEQTQETTFVSQDPSGKEKAGRVKRLLTGSSSPSSDGKGGSGTPSEAQKRRQQVYQAQKRHRNRKAEYIQSLEEEIARLRHVDSEVNSEKNTLSHQNQAMKELLASQSLGAQLDSIDLSSQASSANTMNGAVNMRYDEQIASDRWFVDFLGSDDMQWTSSETSGFESQEQSARTPVTGDSWAALDFILALEYPCRNHVHHPQINPEAWTPDQGDMHGHAMTTTAAVLAGAQRSPPLEGQSSKKPDKWLLPHTEIDKLVELSQKLAIEDTDITPAQAYSATREAVPNDAFLRPVLELLKEPLGKLVHCAHFGSYMDTMVFWEHFDASMQSLKFTRPELGG